MDVEHAKKNPVTNSNSSVGSDSPKDESPPTPNQDSQAFPLFTTTSSTSSSGPIPKDTKKRRQRALSLYTTERPIMPQRPTSAYVSSNSSDSSDTEGSSIFMPEKSSYPSPSTSKEKNGSMRLSGQSRATVTSQKSMPSGTRRMSFKELFRKTFGIKESTEIKPRSLRFHFSVQTTSARDEKELVLELEKNLYARQIAYERENFLFLCRRGDLAFELEVCKLPRLSVNGFRFKRLAGDKWAYKEICTDIVNGITL